MHRYELLVADVDGTLIGADLTPTPRVRRAIESARASGLRVALATGRTPLACRDLLVALDLEGPQIFLDGALIDATAGGPEVFSRPLDVVARDDLVALCREAAIDLELYSRAGYYVERRSPLIRLHEAVQGIRATVVAFAALPSGVTIIKGECLAAGATGRAAVRAIEERLVGRLRFSWAKVAGHPDIEFVNVVHPAISKGTALRELAAWYGIPPSRVVAVGDGHNDRSMIEAAGLGIAMGNAADEVRRAADLVTEAVEADGLARAIERILAGEWPPLGRVSTPAPVAVGPFESRPNLS